MATALFRLLALVALVLMPLGMASSPAGAQAMPAAAAAGHCGDSGQHAPEAPAAPGIDCTVTCAALPAAETPAPAERMVPQAPRAIAFVAPISGIVPEIATPPPKRV